ncbi:MULTISPECIES: MBL fold metallo-hydrolase [Amycolatopsis]|nr:MULTISPECIES: MBL fold metallo-hydrolase [Amycolatopsis]
MAALGREPQDFEAVAFTHSHSDHIGCHAGHLVAEPEWARREPPARPTR